MTLDNLLTRAAMLSAPLDATDLAALRARLFGRLRASGWAPSGPPRGARSSAESDERLLAAFAGGDPDAFDILFDRHAARLNGLARRSLLPADAEEAVHDAFLVLFQKAGEILTHEPVNVAAYLFSTLRYKIGHRLARKQREIYEEAPGEEEPSGEDDALVALLRREDQERLANLIIETCSLLEQEVLAMDIEGAEGVEIAAALDITLGHVRVLRKRALDKLRRVLDPKGDAS